MRARNYKITECDRNKTKMIAGKIIPAIATTTAMITGVVSNEIYKYAQGFNDIEKFKNAYSEGFDPDVDLEALGIANQTTMLNGETEALRKLLEKTMMQKHGVDKLNDHYMVMDTICDATQERQDAMYKLVDDKPDMMLVVGGFNSSNTEHLQEISEDASIPSFWVDTFERLDDESNTITHRLSHGELVETKDWLPAGKITIGVTSGASTPDKVVEDVMDKIMATKAKMGKGAPAR